jgi:hypothetical protein
MDHVALWRTTGEVERITGHQSESRTERFRRNAALDKAISDYTAAMRLKPNYPFVSEFGTNPTQLFGFLCPIRVQL